MIQLRAASPHQGGDRGHEAKQPDMAKNVSTTVDMMTRLSNLLPTGTFLTFQLIAPLATNNGKCGPTERIMTSVSLALLSVGCILANFTDSYTASNGTVYNGFVTTRGLWVPGYDTSVEDPDTGTKFINNTVYKPHLRDFMNAALSVAQFLTLTLFTAPVSSCFYYPRVSESLLKTLPLLLATVVSFFCSFSGTVRHGVGFALPRYSTPSSSGMQQAPTKVLSPVELREQQLPRSVAVLGFD